MLIIRIYWVLPNKWKRKCLFKESCSHHVYRITREQGFVNGYKSLVNRYKVCRPFYTFYNTDDGKNWVILNDQSVIERELTNI